MEDTKRVENQGNGPDGGKKADLEGGLQGSDEKKVPMWRCPVCGWTGDDVLAPHQCRKCMGRLVANRDIREGETWKSYLYDIRNEKISVPIAAVKNIKQEGEKKPGCTDCRFFYHWSTPADWPRYCEPEFWCTLTKTRLKNSTPCDSFEPSRWFRFRRWIKNLFGDGRIRRGRKCRGFGIPDMPGPCPDPPAAPPKGGEWVELGMGKNWNPRIFRSKGEYFPNPIRTQHPSHPDYVCCRVEWAPVAGSFGEWETRAYYARTTDPIEYLQVVHTEKAAVTGGGYQPNQGGDEAAKLK